MPKNDTKESPKNAAKQAVRVSPRSGTPPPVEHQFGGPLANRRNNGSWKKEDTARYKLEQMLKKNEAELVEIANDQKAPLFERRLARHLLKSNDWRVTESMINQVYGQPKQHVEVEQLEPKPLIDLTIPEAETKEEK